MADNPWTLPGEETAPFRRKVDWGSSAAAPPVAAAPEESSTQPPAAQISSATPERAIIDTSQAGPPVPNALESASSAVEALAASSAASTTLRDLANLQSPAVQEDPAVTTAPDAATGAGSAGAGGSAPGPDGLLGLFGGEAPAAPAAPAPARSLLEAFESLAPPPATPPATPPASSDATEALLAAFEAGATPPQVPPAQVPPAPSTEVPSAPETPRPSAGSGENSAEALLAAFEATAPAGAGSAAPAGGLLAAFAEPTPAAPAAGGGLLAALTAETPAAQDPSAAGETYLNFPPPTPDMAPVVDAAAVDAAAVDSAAVDSAAVDAAAVDAAAGGGLGGLFGESPISPVSPALPAPGGGAASVSSEPSPASVPAQGQEATFRAGPGGLADMFSSGDEAGGARPSEPVGTVDTRPPAPPRAPESPLGSELMPVAGPPTPAPTGGAIERSNRAPARSARSKKGAAGKAIAEVRDMRTRDPRYTNPEIWGYADRILRYMQQDQDLQSFLDDLQLTRDAHLDRKQRQQLEALVAPKLVHSDVRILNPHDLPHVWDTVYDELIGLGPLAEFWRDDEVTEIMVDAWDQIVIERDGRLIPTVASFRSPDHASDVARALARKVSGRALSRAIPIVTAELPGARVQFFLGDIARSGLSITMRKFRPLLGMEQLLELGALSEEMADFLADCVMARATVLISGGTGTGKTTMINALSEFIPETERVITIEDSFELQLTNDLVVSFQTKEAASQDDDIRVGQDDLLIGSLRARPDRIIVGEIRDEKGAAVMLQAANTGHDGTMTTIHANNPFAALNFRLAAMLMRSGMPDTSAKTEIATALDLVVQVTRKGRKRFISAISLVDVEQMKDSMLTPERVFEGSVVNGEVRFRRVGGIRPDTEFADKLEDAGVDISRWGKP